MRRYARLYVAFLRYCLTREMEYRASFFAGLFQTIGGNALNVLFVVVIFQNVQAIGDWTIDRMLILIGTYTLTSNLLRGFCWLNMSSLSDWINHGELDLVLTKPVASQFYVSLRRVEFPDFVGALSGVAVVIYGVAHAELHVTPGGVLIYAGLVLCGTVICYALWFSSILFVFWTGRLRNIQHVFEPIMELSRVPTNVLRGPLSSIFTLIVPLAFVATVPAQSLTGALEPWHAGYAVLAAVVALALCNRWWHFALQRYSSASS